MKQFSARAVLGGVLGCIFGGALLLAAGAVQAAKPTERSKQKADAEASRSAIRQKLSALKRDISRTESEKENVADTLAESEEAISDANRSLRELTGEQEQTRSRLAQLAGEQARLAATVEAQKKQLSGLLREQYVAGNEDRIKLLLSGDNPNRINRDLQLLAYVSQAQARLLGSLRDNLAAVDSNRQQAQNANDELHEIAQEEREQKAVLEKEKARRAALLGTLSSRLAIQRKEVGTLERDEQRMAGLVDQLSKLIREQAAAAAAERTRLAALAAARAKARAEAEQARLAAARAKAEAERERLAQQKPKPGAKAPPFTPTPIDDDEPSLAQAAAAKAASKAAAAADKAAAAEAARAEVALAPAAADGAFASLRGRLLAPVSGTLAARFGAKRGGGPSWKGVFIKAAEGSDVRAVAAGRVVFANWMRGFGNLIIVDHGSEYLSIYGNNQALLKHAGDAVKVGDPIASAGNTGGNQESGLYFELRHLGKAFDPAGWVRF